jgi:hypothetical protein
LSQIFFYSVGELTPPPNWKTYRVVMTFKFT